MIAVDQIEVVYPNGTRALRPTSLAFSGGDFTVLLGPSGAGKSTLLRSLNGLVPVTSGRISVEGLGGLDGGGVLRRHRKRTGMVFQQHQLIGRASVLDNVLTGRLGFHSSWRTLLPWSPGEKRLALDAVERVGLIDYALRRADRLSGGQQQRVGIARALVQKPALILADEPVASLDPASADRVLALLHRVCKQDGILAIVSLHQLDFARRYADRIIGMAQGDVVFDGPPSRFGRTETGLVYGDAPKSDSDADIPPARTGTYA